MYAISFFQGMVFYSSISTLYRKTNGVSIFEITLIEGISLILCLLLEIPWGVIADKIGYKKVMVICSVLFLISKVVFWQSTNFLWFLVERIIISFVFSGLSGVDTNILFLSSKKGQSQHIFGIYESLGRAGLLIATVIYSVFTDGNYRIAAFLTIIPYSIAAILSFFLSEVKPLNTQKEHREFKRLLCNVLKDKYLVLFICGMALFNETHQIITVFLNQLQFEKSGMSDSTIGVVFIFTNIIGLLSFLSFKITKYLSTKKTIIYSFVVTIIACCVLAVTDHALFSIVGVMVVRFIFVILTPLQNTLKNAQVNSLNRATTLSIFSIISSSIGVFVNVGFGAIAKIDISLAFYFGASICVIGLGGMIAWFRKETEQTGKIPTSFS